MTEDVPGAEAYQRLLDWLHRQALGAWDIPALQSGLVAQLSEVGFSLQRMHVGVPLLHPLYAVGAYTWKAGSGVETDLYAREATQDEIWQRTPMRPIYESGAVDGRVPIESVADLREFPMLEDARARGSTEYFVQLFGFDDRSVHPELQEGIVISWITDTPGGFSNGQIDLLRRLHLPLCVHIKNLTDRRLVEDVVDAYLGSYSGRRVLSGQIQRGDGDLIDAVVFFCDLRGSSTLAERHDYRGFLEILNQYFETTVAPVPKHGGEILRFIGDASLAIFPFERFDDRTAACRAAFGSACDAVRRGAELNATRRAAGEMEIGFGIGLHPGTVLYGNIGIANRLEFSVIGRAANEAARIESQCRELGEQILVSRAFADMLPGAWHSHGAFDLRNIVEPIEILSPLPEAIPSF